MFSYTCTPATCPYTHSHVCAPTNSQSRHVNAILSPHNYKHSPPLQGPGRWLAKNPEARLSSRLAQGKKKQRGSQSLSVILQCGEVGMRGPCMPRERSTDLDMGPSGRGASWLLEMAQRTENVGVRRKSLCPQSEPLPFAEAWVPYGSPFQHRRPTDPALSKNLSLL